MNILVLGGNRFFGKKVVRLLIKKSKFKIFILNRNRKKNLFKSSNNRLTFIKSDRNNLKKLKSFFKRTKIDIIFDNIAYNLNDIKVLFKASRLQFDRYIFSSTVMVNLLSKQKSSTRILKQNYEKSEILYAKNKLEIEKYIRRQKKIKYVIFRIHNVLGKNDFSKKSQEVLFAKNKDLKKFNIKNNDTFQFMYDNDLSRVIYYIILNKKIFNKTIPLANDAVKAKYFYEQIREKIKTKGKKNNFYNNFVINRRLFPFPKNFTINNSKLKKIINFKLSNINQILKKVI